MPKYFYDPFTKRMIDEDKDPFLLDFQDEDESQEKIQDEIEDFSWNECDDLEVI
jgi:hypothetical protein